MTPEEIEQILQSNAKAIQSNSEGISELRRITAEINRRIDSSLAQIASNTSAILADHTLIYQRLERLEENQIRLIDILSSMNKRV